MNGLISRIWVIVILTAALTQTGTPMSAKKIKMGFDAKKIENRDESVSDLLNFEPCDSLTASKIRFSGFDKKWSSSTESFFVTNSGEETIRELMVQLDYFMPDGRQLHSRQERITTEIPGGETRNVEIRSWDRQRSFHYILSQGKRNGTTGFDVKIRILRVKFR